MWFQRSRVRIPSIAQFQKLLFMPEILKAVLLGVVQGITEFFPVSSSAHLYFFKKFLELDNASPLLELSCHVGTLGCVALYLRSEIREVLCSFSKLKNIIFALIPLIPVYFFLKPLIFHFSSLKFMGFFFCCSALLLFISSYAKVDTSESNKKKRDFLFIGSMQAIALLPGISRSGATISAARLRGWSLASSVIFSFLLSIPTISGGFLLELWKSKSEYVIFKWIYLAAALSSFVTGLLTIRLFFFILKKGRFSIFAWYCLVLGIILLCNYV